MGSCRDECAAEMTEERGAFGNFGSLLEWADLIISEIQIEGTRGETRNIDGADYGRGNAVGCGSDVGCIVVGYIVNLDRSMGYTTRP